MHTESPQQQARVWSIPIAIRPNRAKGTPPTKEFLLQWIGQHREEIMDIFHEAGALLLRGFEVFEPQDFEDVALALDPHLGCQYLGTSPRAPVTKYTFTASELPRFFPIPQHLEMSFLRNNRPEHLFFFCQREPETGGETPLTDCSAVWRDLDPALREKFRSKGVTYIRNYCGPQDWKWDPWMLKRWPEIFETRDKSVVEELCKMDDIEVEWRKNDALRLRNSCSAFIQHHSGKEVWCNHSLVFHPSQAAGEYKRIAQHTKKWWHFFLTFILYLVLVLRKLVQKEESQGMNCLFGDGQTISYSEMEQVREAVWKNSVFFPYQRGDVTMIDNTLVRVWRADSAPCPPHPLPS